MRQPDMTNFTGTRECGAAQPQVTCQDLNRLDRALMKIPVPDLKPVDVHEIMTNPQIPPYRLPAWVWVTVVLAVLFSIVPLVGLCRQWGLATKLRAAMVLLERLALGGPCGFRGSAERALWQSCIALAGCGLAGLVVSMVIDLVEPQRQGGV